MNKQGPLRWIVLGVLLSLAWAVAQSNVTTITVPPNAIVQIVTNQLVTNPPPVDIMPPVLDQQRIHQMSLELRAARMMAGRLSAPYSQRFEVRITEEVASMVSDMDDRGVPTGTFSAVTNVVTTLFPLGTNVVIRGATRDGSISLVLTQQVKTGDVFFIYRSRRDRE